MTQHPAFRYFVRQGLNSTVVVMSNEQEDIWNCDWARDKRKGSARTLMTFSNYRLLK